jgi:hypothetical protein
VHETGTGSLLGGLPLKIAMIKSKENLKVIRPAASLHPFKYHVGIFKI